jgi:hypothetical protein
MSENKTMPTDASVDDFINGVENIKRKQDAFVVLELYKKITGLPPIMWGSSIIGFGEYRYEYSSGRRGDMFRAGFSPRKAAMTFYLGSNFPYAEQLYVKLGKHKRSVACVYVNKLSDVDLDVLCKLIELDFNASKPSSAF